MRDSQLRGGKFSVDSATIKILSCPDCKKETELILFESDEKFYLNCNECKTLFPVKDVIYFTQNCNPRKCNLECSKTCSEKAFYFKMILPFAKSKRVHINDNCTHCGKCVDACPFKGLVSVKTPILYPKIKNKFIEDKVIPLKRYSGELKQFTDKLRPLDYSRLIPSTELTFYYLAERMDRLNFMGLVFDDGCGSQNFKAYLEGKLRVDVFGIDMRVDHYSYYPINVLADSEHLPIKSQVIDIITSNFVLEHTEDQISYLSEIRRILKSGSKAFVSVPTPVYHIAYFFCLEGWMKYFIHIINSPLRFIMNPVKDFLMERAHEKEWSQDSRKGVTFLEEMKRWSSKKWAHSIKKSGLSILDEKLTGNILSLNRGWFKRFSNSKKYGVHLTYSLERL